MRRQKTNSLQRFMSAGYVDKDSMKADMKADKAADFVMPDGVPPLPVSFDKAVGHMVEKD